MGHHRPWLAAVLAVLVAGLGHAYLRRWRRAALWFLAILGVGVALSATFADPETMGPTDLPVTVVGPLLLLYGLSAVDAFRIARTSRRASAVASAVDRDEPVDGDDPEAERATDACPHCGKSTDPDLDFCTWCTEPLAPEGTGERTTE